VANSRGQVFSQPLRFDQLGVKKAEVSVSPKLEFVDVNKIDLPKNIQKHLSDKLSRVRSLQGPMRLHIFVGTIDEIRPLLTLEVAKTGLPAVLYNEDGQKFSLVMPASVSLTVDAEKRKCTSPQRLYAATWSITDGTKNLLFCN